MKYNVEVTLSRIIGEEPVYGTVEFESTSKLDDDEIRERLKGADIPWATELDTNPRLERDDEIFDVNYYDYSSNEYLWGTSW